MADQTTTALKQTERLAWLRLIRSENVGPIIFRQLLARYGKAEAALAALPELARRGGRRRPIRICTRAAAEDELASLDSLGARLVALCEPDYPAALAAVEDAPPVIAMLGHPHLARLPAVAVVGARNASANGRRLAESLARDLAAAGYLVASGLARGIDAAAHRGALDKATAAVVAGGVDVVYPQENLELYEAIKAQGLIIAELAPGTRPKASHFPRRNRIISGMALGTLVVEAAPRSGSLITARFALEQGREVFAVPGSPLDPRARGCNGLIRQGAVLVESAEDIISALQPLLRSPLSERRGGAYEGDLLASGNEQDIADAREILMEMLGASAVTVDELIRQCQLSPATVTMALLELELAGCVERQPGNKVVLLLEPNSGGR